MHTRVILYTILRNDNVHRRHHDAYLASQHLVIAPKVSEAYLVTDDPNAGHAVGTAKMFLNCGRPFRPRSTRGPMAINSTNRTQK